MKRRVSITLSDIVTNMTYKGPLNGKVGDVRIIEYSVREGKKTKYVTLTLIAKSYCPSADPDYPKFAVERLHQDVPVEWECIDYKEEICEDEEKCECTI